MTDYRDAAFGRDIPVTFDRDVDLEGSAEYLAELYSDGDWGRNRIWLCVASGKLAVQFREDGQITRTHPVVDLRLDAAKIRRRLEDRLRKSNDLTTLLRAVRVVGDVKILD